MCCRWGRRLLLLLGASRVEGREGVCGVVWSFCAGIHDEDEDEDDGNGNGNGRRVCVSERYILGRWQSTGMYPIIQ